jgi:hypothetical protein
LRSSASARSSNDIEVPSAMTFSRLRFPGVTLV